MAKSALITGITGQDGSYLAELLLDKGYEVHGIVRRTSVRNDQRIAHIADRLNLHFGDMSDGTSLREAVAASKPDEVYNLAAQSHVGVSFKKPEITFDIGGAGVLRLLEAVRHHAPQARVYQASTSEIYGLPDTAPQNEDTLFAPCSPYGVAKLAAYWLIHTYRDGYSIHGSNGILFNHESPRRGDNFVTRKITIAMANIAKGKQEFLGIGNLESKRDWGYAKDYVEAQWLILQQDEPDDYVIATGKAYSVREFIENASRVAGFDLAWEGEGMDEVGRDRKSGKVIVKIDKDFYRPTDPMCLLGDPTKSKKKLGWSPRTSFEELVELMVKADLDAIK